MYGKCVGRCRRGDAHIAAAWVERKVCKSCSVYECLDDAGSRCCIPDGARKYPERKAVSWCCCTTYLKLLIYVRSRKRCDITCD